MILAFIWAAALGGLGVCLQCRFFRVLVLVVCKCCGLFLGFRACMGIGFMQDLSSEPAFSLQSDPKP